MDPSSDPPNRNTGSNPSEFPLPPPPIPSVLTPPLISVTTPDFPPPPPTIIVPADQEDLSSVVVVPSNFNNNNNALNTPPSKTFQPVDTEVRLEPRTLFKKRERRSFMVNPISGTRSRKRSSLSSSLIPPETASNTKRSEVIGAEEAENGVGICGLLLTGISWLVVIVTLPFSLCVCFKVVQEYERAVIFRLGRLLQGGSRGPGIFFVLPCIESYQKVDLRTITLGVPPQEVLTKDSVTVSVDAVVYYRVSNATVSVANVENAHHSTRLLAQTTLRNILGTKNLHEILSDRESISGSMQAALDEATEPWGIKVERVEIKDVRLPVQLQRAMAAEAEAAREARAKVIAAEGEQKASRALRDASDVMAGSSSALQLRYLQTLNTISAEKNSTIVFPLPIDILSHLLKPKED